MKQVSTGDMPRPAPKVNAPAPARGTRQSKGRKKSKASPALTSNMLSARLVAGILRSSFGPRGLDKLFEDNTGQVHVTSDGAQILGKSQSGNPVARMITEMGKAVDSEVGDGTISAAILLSALVEAGVQLVERGLHPSQVVKGYAMALARALEELEEIAEPVRYDDKELLVRLAATSVQSKLAAKGVPGLAEMLASAAIGAAERRGDHYILDLSKITIRRIPEGSLADTRLINGLVIDKDLINAYMPKKVENAKILVGDISLVVKKTISDAKIEITDPEGVSRLGRDRREMLKRIADRIIASGANVLINREGCDDFVAHDLAKAGVMALRHVKIQDVANVAEATGATVVDAKRDIRPEDLGYAALVEERPVPGANRAKTWLFVEGCKDPKALTVLLCGTSWYVTDEAERSIHDALMVLKDIIEKPSVVAGGGAVEAEVSRRLRTWCLSLDGREQLAAWAFADALEEIPRALAEKTATHAVDAVIEIRAKHAEGQRWMGIESRSGKVKDMFAEGILEPVAVKEMVLKAAAETACALIRIDRVMDKEAPRAWRRKSEMNEWQKNRLRPPTTRESEDFQDAAEHFPINKPKDVRYPL